MTNSISCIINIDNNIQDGICLINKELSHQIGLTNNYDKVYICQLDLIDNQQISYIINLKIDSNHSNLYYNNHSYILLHNGFKFLNEKKVIIKKLNLIPFYQDEFFIQSIQVDFIGPFNTSLFNHTSIYLLNYYFIIQSLKRQFYMYLKLISNDVSIYKANLTHLLNGKRLTFIINEEFYFFQVNLKEKLQSYNLILNQNDSYNFDLSYISDIRIIPHIKGFINNYSFLQRKDQLIIEKYYVNKFQDLIDILNLETYNLKSILYLDITYIINRYIHQNNVSIKIINNFREKLIEKLQILLFNMIKTNKYDQDNKDCINIYFYNYFHTFSNISNNNIQDELFIKFSNYNCSIKFIFMEYINHRLELFSNSCKLENNQYQHLNSKFSKLITNISNIVNNNYNKESYIFNNYTDVNEYKKEKHEFKKLSYFELGNYLNKYISKIRLNKNLDNFLKIWYFYIIINKSNEMNDNHYLYIKMIYWIMKICFNITNKETILGIIKIMFEYSLIDLRTYKILELELIDIVNNKQVLIENEESINTDLNPIIKLVDEEMFLYKLFDNKIEKLNKIMNQVFIPRILIYNSKYNKGFNNLSLIKQELIKFIKKNYMNYKLINEHLLNLVSPYVGQSEYNIRKLFNTKVPTILLLEGIDMISSNSFTYLDKDVNEIYDVNNLSTNYEKMSIKSYNLLNCDIKNKIQFKTRYHELELRSIFNRNKNYNIGNLRKDEDINSNRTLLTTLLLCLDNIEKKNQNVIVIALSNKDISELDDSITRAGRLDSHICI